MMRKRWLAVLALVAGLCGGAWATDFYNLGYGEGRRIGTYDRQTGRAYQPGNYSAYKHGGSVSGSANKQAYRNGFMAGYNESFGRGDAHWRGHDRDHDRWERREHDRDDDRWERREGYEYRTYDRDGRPPGWSKGEKTGWGDCGLPPGQAKKYGCRTYVYEGRPHYYYEDERGRIVVRRPEIHAHADADVR
jgi:hypothetical protein